MSSDATLLYIVGFLLYIRIYYDVLKMVIGHLLEYIVLP